MVSSFIAGLGFGPSVIVAIGAQNTYILRQGALRRRVTTAVAVCSLSDIVLIAAGVAGADAVLTARQSLLSAVRIAGAGLLLAYGAFAARHA